MTVLSHVFLGVLYVLLIFTSTKPGFERKLFECVQTLWKWFDLALFMSFVVCLKKHAYIVVGFVYVVVRAVYVYIQDLKKTMTKTT